ncbi:MAG TPA: hypothetical protein VGE37_13295 [Archangium sp.]
MEIERALKELLGEDVEVIEPEDEAVPPPDPIDDLPHLEPLDIDLDEELPLEWSPMPVGRKPEPLKSASRLSSFPTVAH